MDARERGAHPGFRREVGGKGGGGDIERGEAYAADGATVSGLQFLGYVLRLDHDAAVLSVLIDAGDVSDFFDNSSKHDENSSQPEAEAVGMGHANRLLRQNPLRSARS